MITKLRVRNYKSLEDVELSLRPLTIFVGPNNAGKSNVFDCLLFLKELLGQGEPAVHSRGGYRYIVWGGDLKRTLGIEVESTFVDVEGRERTCDYQIELAGGPIHYSLVKELLLVRDGETDRKILEFPAERRNAQTWDECGNPVTSYSSISQRPYASVSSRPSILQSFCDSVEGWSFHNFVPSHMASPTPAKRDFRLLREGDNLSTVLHTLHSEYGSDFGEIEDLFKTGIPEIRQVITALTEEGQTYVSFEEKGFDQRIPAWNMSDGVLHLLALLTILYSPEPPSLAAIEEPENWVHPGILELVADMLKSASRRTQVLITTHSPYLLNFMSPEDLVIVEKADGKTECKPVEDREGVKEALKVLGLGEFWYSGSIGGTP